MTGTLVAHPASRKPILATFGPTTAAVVRRFSSMCVIFVAVFSATTSNAAESADSIEVVRVLAAQDAMVLRVGERLTVMGARLCGEVGRSAGMNVQSLSQYNQALRSAAQTELGLAYQPTVAHLASGGAAEAAGIRPHDVIVAIDGRTFPESGTDASGRGRFSDIEAAHAVIDQALQDGRADVTIKRGGQTKSVTLVPRPACRVRFDVKAGKAEGASAGRDYVQVTSGLIAEVKNDGELAAILAHEMAHMILAHADRKRAKQGRISVRASEIEADRLSVYLLDAAGYGIDGGVAFWGRWGKANDLGIFSDRSHPGWKKRVAILESEGAVIAREKAAGNPVKVPADLRLTS